MDGPSFSQQKRDCSPKDRAVDILTPSYWTIELLSHFRTENYQEFKTTTLTLCLDLKTFSFLFLGNVRPSPLYSSFRELWDTDHHLRRRVHTPIQKWQDNYSDSPTLILTLFVGVITKISKRKKDHPSSFQFLSDFDCVPQPTCFDQLGTRRQISDCHYPDRMTTFNVTE